MAKLTPHDKIYKYFEKKNANDVKIILVRDSGFVASGCSVGFFVNTDLIADLVRSQRVDIYLPPGEYYFGAGTSKNNTGLCSYTKNKGMKVVIDEAKENTFRMWFTHDDYGIAPFKY